MLTPLTRCLLATVGGIHWYPLLWGMVVESEPMGKPRSECWLSMLWYVEYVEYDEYAPLPARAAPLLPPEAEAMWVRRWQQRLSVWLHLTPSRHVLRYLAPSIAGGVSFSSRLPVWLYP